MSQTGREFALGLALPVKLQDLIGRALAPV
jgi:hypothetical protein